ncbi:MAG: undecaprenyl diphosphate synthase family protein [Desulfurococcales archaeon]|nr:undecaprenyl diphosphate synthase family protein [Desulfurococcales archaeon]
MENSITGNLATSATKIQRKIKELVKGSVDTYLDPSKLPLHVGIIPDGNRRYSRLANLSYKIAYNLGYENLRNIMKELLRIGVKYLSVYAMSLDNCMKRGSEELETLYDLIVRGVEELSRDEDLISNGIRVVFFGDLSLLPGSIVDRILKLENSTKNRIGGILSIALCYSTVWEINMDKKGVERPISYRMLPPIDLVIRTGDRKRLSDFFPVNARYAELYFSEKPWPAFSIADLYQAIRWFQGVQRNFGK